MKQVELVKYLLPAFGIAFMLPVHAFAATLFLSPSSQNVAVGQTFTVSVDISSLGQAMNAASGDISFPADEVQVTSISRASSIMNLWVRDPSFSNNVNGGTIDFEGVALNPGYLGDSGDVIDIQFQAVAPGTAQLNFSSGAVLANDGQGTNILDNLVGSNVTIVPAGSANNSGGNGARPSIAISTDPSTAQSGWYNLQSLTFLWTVPPGANAVNYAISKSPDYELPKTPQAVVSSESYDLANLDDGTWYFDVRAETGGVWTPVATRILQIDHTPPDPFTITERSQDIAAPSNPDPEFQWAATDKTSGIAGYQAKIGNGDWFNPAGLLQGGFYILPKQSPAASRTLTVRAYDKAGNFTEESINFRIAASCSPTNPWCRFISFLSQWFWLMVLIAAGLIGFAYFLLYRMYLVKMELRAGLEDLKRELREDIKKLEKENKDQYSKVKDATLDIAKHIDEEMEKELQRLQEKDGQK